MRLTGSFHTIVTHGRSGETASAAEVTSCSTGARERVAAVTEPTLGAPGRPQRPVPCASLRLGWVREPDEPPRCEHGAADRPLRADDAPGRPRLWRGAPSMRLRGLRPAPARR